MPSTNGETPKHKTFSHIYLEDDAKALVKTDEVLSHFPNAEIISISDYKEVFNRNQQNFALQKRNPKLILAKRRDEFLYRGSTIAPNFGEDNFFYNTLALNCLYDCEYCYLQGMFPSAHLVLFVNNEDFLSRVEEELKDLSSMYLCLSYDTDLLTLEHFTGYCKEWIEFGRNQEKLKIELRTKSAAINPLLTIPAHDGVILAWTLSPQSIVEKYEHGTPSLRARLKAAKKAAEHGYRIRICIDPILPLEGKHSWEKEYQDLLQQIADELPNEAISEISLGTFRIGKGYFKQLKKVKPSSKLVYEPYEEHDGVVRYSDKKEEEVLSFVRDAAQKLFPTQTIDLLIGA